jgi:hypothetical protein
VPHFPNDRVFRKIGIPEGEISLEGLQSNPVAKHIPNIGQPGGVAVIQPEPGNKFGYFIIQGKLFFVVKVGN